MARTEPALIKGLYVVLLEEKDGREVVAYAQTKEGCIPLVAAIEDGERLGYLKTAAQELAKRQKAVVRLAMFLRQAVVEVYRPH